ncbi:MAG: protein kinase domain-containing protein [Polyangiaceae bacterium]
MADWSPGSNIRKYRIDARLGEGATSVVYAATHVNNGLRVAIKVLHSELAMEQEIKTRFLREGYAANSIQHPGVARVLDDDTLEDGTVFIVMEFLDGESLAARAARLGGVLPVQEMLPVADRLLDVLAAAHDQGTVHRDIKPDNVFLTRDGAIKVLDFGLARMKQNAEKFFLEATGAGVVLGTIDFMSPEQARGNPKEVDERSDVFGMGGLLFEVLAGYGPYGRQPDENITLKRAVAGQVASIDEACRSYGIAKRIRAITERAIHPDVNKRYARVTDLQSDLRAFLHGGLHLPQKRFAKGELIVREGDKGDCAYMIVAGTCRAFRTVEGREETLSMMEPGDAFGEMALILFEPRAASVAAEDDVTVLVLDQATLNEGLGLSGWTGALVRALAQRFADLEQLVRTSGVRR